MRTRQDDSTGKSANGRQRGWGEGTIIERRTKSGEIRFLAQGWVRGERHAKTFKTRPEAQRWLRNTGTDGERGLTLGKDGRVTVASFLRSWLEAKKVSLKPKALQDYTWAVERHLAPALQSIKLSDLNGRQLQALYAKKLAEGLSPRSVHHLHRVIHNALDDGVRDGDVPSNAADRATAPKPERVEFPVWTPEQARRFIDGVADDRWEAAFILSITCGLRVGELCGLKWEDVDVEAGTIQVRRTRQRIRRAPSDDTEPASVVVDGTPKTKRGARRIVLPAIAAAALRRWRIAQKKERVRAGPLWQESGYVVTYLIGTAIEPGQFSKEFAKVVSRLGLPKIRVHDIRHICATLLLSQNVNPKLVQELLGHSQISVTLDLYSHVLPAMHHETARTMDRLFGAG
jgi:integrase